MDCWGRTATPSPIKQESIIEMMYIESKDCVYTTETQEKHVIRKVMNRLWGHYDAERALKIGSAMGIRRG
jgi:hypothetical protein